MKLLARYLDRLMFKVMQEITASKEKNEHRDLYHMWYQLRNSPSFRPLRWWIMTGAYDEAENPSLSYSAFIVIFALAAIYAVAIGIIGGLTEIVGYPPYLSITLCLIIGLFCVLQLYGLVRNAFENRRLSTSLHREPMSGYE